VTNELQVKRSVPSWGRAVHLVGVLSAAVVPAYLLLLIVRGTPMQFNDYYGMLGQIYTPEGGFKPSGLLLHANEHLVAIPKLIYVANVWLFGGSNITLGVFVWLVSAATVVVIFLGLRQVFRVGPSTQVVLAWALAVLVFPLSALHNYQLAMSGTSWIAANLFAVCAILAMVRRRPLVAALFGALGTFTYGTGLAIWPALILVLILQRRFTVRDAVMLGIGAVSVLVERVTASSVDYHPPIVTNPVALLRSVDLSAGSLFTHSVDAALILGALVLGFTGYVVHRANPAGRSERPNAALTGIAAFGFGVFLMFALSRTGFGDEMFLSSRYMAVVALFILSLVLLSLVVFGESSVWRWAVVASLIMALVAAVPTIGALKSSVRSQDVGAIAARLGVAEGVVIGFRPSSSQTMEALGHYPFNGAGDRLACGLFGDTLDPARIGTSETVSGYIDSMEPTSNSYAVRITGWAYSTSPIECILVVDETNQVVGAALPGVTRDDVRKAIGVARSNLGWEGIARAVLDEGLRVVVVVAGSDDFYLLPDATSGEA